MLVLLLLREVERDESFKVSEVGMCISFNQSLRILL